MWDRTATTLLRNKTVSPPFFCSCEDPPPPGLTRASCASVCSSGLKPISSSVVIEWRRKGHDFCRSRDGSLQFATLHFKHRGSRAGHPARTFVTRRLNSGNLQVPDSTVYTHSEIVQVNIKRTKPRLRRPILSNQTSSLHLQPPTPS
jgi:hypothetical protein